jgi:hypothetical protein
VLRLEELVEIVELKAHDIPVDSRGSWCREGKSGSEYLFAGDWSRFLPRLVLRSFFLGFLGGVLWIIATDALSEVSDGFAQTAADLGQLRWAENNQSDHKDYDQFLQSDSKHYSSLCEKLRMKSPSFPNTSIGNLGETETRPPIKHPGMTPLGKFSVEALQSRDGVDFARPLSSPSVTETKASLQAIRTQFKNCERGKVKHHGSSDRDANDEGQPYTAENIPFGFGERFRALPTLRPSASVLIR